ncbi:MAG TPA: DUF4897 domain-containing protein [Petrotogaceae bacterium]|jgi:hypothetical protein|nr:DUF4897 domain-containing protein [Petrotogaceae bacterium]HOG34545.1 DUF4897 domain-containing protein [Petrotogaceae bacterium]HOT30581.1 DUF4897 domain-containing protein [Petrotogaceae bacterium]HPA93062.1 DUF4897 domain-containing protein [Petrotogaceae bacterium]HPX15451.1 DUF4897 domain-containing protein [Petrotogaceae bacterium]
MFWKKDKNSEPVNPELAREVNRKKSNSNFMIITIIFFAGLFVVNYFMFQGMQVKYDVISQKICYIVNEDMSVILSSDMNLRANDQKSYDKLIEGFKTSDSEKKKKYEEFLDGLEKDSQKQLQVISYSSTSTTQDLYLTVKEDVRITGFIEKSDDYTYIFNLKNQKLKIDDKTSLYIYAPEGWIIQSAVPVPLIIENEYAMWKNAGQMDFPNVIMIRQPQ